MIARCSECEEWDDWIKKCMVEECIYTGKENDER